MLGFYMNWRDCHPGKRRASSFNSQGGGGGGGGGGLGVN